MTQLVIHTGMPLTGADLVRDQLVACREPLERAGVVLVARDGSKAWDRAVRDVLGGEVPRPLIRLSRRKQQEQSHTVLLSSESAARALVSMSNVTALRAFGRDHGLSTKVVLVVREQLQLINEMYCNQVMRLETSASFASFVGETVASAGLELGDQFTALQDSPGIDVFAVPYSRFDGHVAAGVVLAAAGLSEEPALTSTMATATRGSASGSTALPGPVLVTALRLLHKRLTRLGVIRRRPTDQLLAAATVMRERARAEAWDDATFWGWSEELATSAQQHYRPGNEVFAARAWGTVWPDAAPARQQTRLDLPSEPPSRVSDVITMIHRVVDELTAAPPSSGAA